MWHKILLHEQFPACEGLDTLGPCLQYSVCGGEFGQILFTGSHHWITVSNIGCTLGAEVNIYDSLNHGNVNSQVKKQVAAILYAKAPEMVLHIRPVQQQTNGTDCGVFAITFLTSLLNGHEPSTQMYDNDELRPYLLTCISSGSMTPFPQAQASRVRKRKARKVSVKLFCSCCMPWDKNDNKARATQMASCDACGEWYHRSCENIPDGVFTGTLHSWQCSICAK